MEEKQIAKDRLEVFEKIKQYEQEGGESLFKDVENDPPSKTLMPEDVDYLKKKLSSKIKYHSTKRIIRIAVPKQPSPSAPISASVSLNFSNIKSKMALKGKMQYIKRTLLLKSLYIQRPI